MSAGAAGEIKGLGVDASGDAEATVKRPDGMLFVVISSPTSTAGYSQASRYPLELGATEGALRQLPATAIPGVALFELADGAVKLCKALPDGSIATEFDVKTQEVTFAQPAASATWWSKSSPICQHETKMLERITKALESASSDLATAEASSTASQDLIGRLYMEKKKLSLEKAAKEKLVNDLIASAPRDFAAAASRRVLRLGVNFVDERLFLLKPVHTPQLQQSVVAFTMATMISADEKKPMLLSMSPGLSALKVASGSLVLGARIRLRHVHTRGFLTSGARTYTHTDTSGQQQVWCISTETKDNVWVVNGAHGSAVVDGPVLNNATIRLLHLATNLNLHSHSARSPATQQQEVTGCSGDANDNWSVKCGTNGKWEFGQVIQLLHVNTNHRLHSHPSKFASSSTEQLQEVTGYALGDYNDDWTAVPAD